MLDKCVIISFMIKKIAVKFRESVKKNQKSLDNEKLLKLIFYFLRIFFSFSKIFSANCFNKKIDFHISISHKIFF